MVKAHIKTLHLVCTSPLLAFNNLNCSRFLLILFKDHSSDNSSVYISTCTGLFHYQPVCLCLFVYLPVFVLMPTYLFMLFQPTVPKSFSPLIGSFKGGVTFLSPNWSSISDVRSVVRLQQAFL